MRRVYRYRMYPTTAQTVALWRQTDLLRGFYNSALEQRIAAWRNQRVSLSYYDQAAEIAAVKRECLTYAPIHTHLLQDVLKRLDRAFKAFFRRCRSGEKPGFPRFKGRDRYGTFSFQDASRGNGAALVAGGQRVRLSGIGNVKFKYHCADPTKHGYRPMEGALKTIGVTRDGDGHWYVLVTRDVAPRSLPATGREVGIDLGLSSFLATSDGELVSNPRPLETARLDVERAQRRVAKRKKGSHRRRKARVLLAQAHAHVRDVRKDFQHKTARSLVRRYDRIAVEDLNVLGLSRGRLARSVHDAAWAQFIGILAAKAEEAGREMVKVDPRGTSQVCSACGETVHKDLSVRVHRCPHCGYTANRDVNAARNVVWLGRSLRRAAPARGDSEDPRSPLLAL